MSRSAVQSHRWWGALGILSVIVLIVSACGSSAPTATAVATAAQTTVATTAPTAAVTSGETASMSTLVAQAIAATKANTGPQTEWTGPTTGPTAVKGKFVVVVSGDQNNGSDLDWATASAQAATAIGWKNTTLDGKATVSGWEAAVTEAIALHPDGIVLAGIDGSAVEPLLKKAVAAGIVIVGQHNSATPGPVADWGEYYNIGQTVGDIETALFNYIVADSSGQAHVLLTLDDLYAIAVAKTKFLANLLTTCPGCTNLGTVNVPSATISTETAARVTGWVSQYKPPFYLWACGDALSDYVPAALQAGGMTPGQIKLIGADGTATAYQRIRDGWQVATVPEPLFEEGWIAIDELNRAFASQPAYDFTVQAYVVDKANVDLEGGAQNSFDPTNNYKQHFEALWGVAGS